VAGVSALSVRIEEKRFRDANGGPGHLAISDLHFDVAEREFICILGPSGGGKTTALNIIGGLDRDFTGEVRFNEPDARDHLAYVFQEPRLLPWRTLLDNVALPIARQPDSRARAMGWLDRVGLKDFAHHYPGQTSLGMQRRAALARAFATEPSLMLMDEPFVSLDEASAEDLRGLLGNLCRAEPVTVLFVTHDVREAIRLAHRILLFTAAPARVAAEVNVTLSPGERANPRAVEAFRARYLPPAPAASEFSLSRDGDIRLQAAQPET
jgi:NitT/TauT family transport system ATP-binding protein